MSTFTVHVPPGIVDDAARADATVFVREGFDGAAFLFGPLCLLYRGLWRATAVWIAAAAALLAVAIAFGLGGVPRALLYLVLAVLTGLEAAEARRRALGRAGFIPAAVLSGVTREAGERLFFSGTPLTDPLPTGPGAPPRGGAGRRTVIGLFPQPGDRTAGGRA